MERKGLIRRVRSDTDGRATRIWLTPGGKTLLAQLKPIAAAVDLKILGTISAAEQQRLISLLATIHRNVDGSR